MREAIKYLENYDTTLSSFKLSVIGRWFYNSKYIEAIANQIKTALEQFPEDERDDVFILFSAHSIPVKFMLEGDPYPMEIAASANYVMDKLGRNNSFRISWQSKVFGQWLAPTTEHTVKKLAEKNWKHLIICPLGFTSDHLETLYELDIELIQQN